MSTETEILAAVDAMPSHRKARLMPKLRQRLEDYYDLQAVKRAQATGIYHDYESVLVIEAIGDRKDIYR